MVNRNIVVIGAGVSGLTTALLLSKNEKNDITVCAKWSPGDYDAEYASPIAGAHYVPVSVDGDPVEWDKNTWPELERLASHCPEAGIHFQKMEIYNREKDTNSSSSIGQFFPGLLYTDPWWKDTVPDFQLIPKARLAEIGSDVSSGTSFTSVCINTPMYLSWLVGQCRKNGVVMKRMTFKHISDAASAHHSGNKADVIVNCTGIGANKLGGVDDKNVIPGRGQVVVVRNDPGIMCTISGTDDGDGEMTYIMQRAAGGGTILGGCYQKGNWESQPDPNLAIRIMKRCVELCPTLTGGKGIEALDIVRHAVGLRPIRLNGTRLEKERINGTWVVHNYGHGGYGYQSSYGCSQVAVKLVDEALDPSVKL